MVRIHCIYKIFRHGILIGMMVCLADIHLSTCLTGFCFDIDMVAILVQKSACDIATGVIAERTVIHSQDQTLCIFMLPSCNILSIKIIVTYGLRTLSCPHLCVCSNVTD